MYFRLILTVTNRLIYAKLILIGSTYWTEEGETGREREPHQVPIGCNGNPV